MYLSDMDGVIKESEEKDGVAFSSRENFLEGQNDLIGWLVFMWPLVVAPILEGGNFCPRIIGRGQKTLPRTMVEDARGVG